MNQGTVRSGTGIDSPATKERLNSQTRSAQVGSGVPVHASGARYRHVARVRLQTQLSLPVAFSHAEDGARGGAGRTCKWTAVTYTADLTGYRVGVTSVVLTSVEY